MSTTIEQREPRTGDGAALALMAIVLAAVFFAADHTLSRSQLETFAEEVSTIEHSAAAGSTLRRVAFCGLAAFGALCLLTPGRRFQFAGPLAWLLAATLLWCLASNAWSTNPHLTIRRSALLAFAFAGAVGVARRLSLDDLCKVTLAITLTYAMVGVAVELALGTMRPFAADYRFAGTIHPNLQGTNCAALCLAAAMFIGPGRRTSWAAACVFAFGLLLLVLTKSRTATVCCLAALASLWLMRSSWPARLYGALGAAGVGCAAVWAALVCGAPIDRYADAMGRMGRPSADMGALTGRVPLWGKLLGLAEHHPLIGYGYGGFWDPQRIDLASWIIGSGVSHAHSTYLELLLAVGAVGALLAVATAGVGTWLAIRGYVTTGERGEAFLTALLVYGVVNAMLESTFASPSLVPFLAACGLCQLAFFTAEADEPADRILEPTPCASAAAPTHHFAKETT